MDQFAGTKIDSFLAPLSEFISCSPGQTYFLTGGGHDLIIRSTCISKLFLIDVLLHILAQNFGCLKAGYLIAANLILYSVHGQKCVPTTVSFPTIQRSHITVLIQ
jgi:hypothetical protein